MSEALQVVLLGVDYATDMCAAARKRLDQVQAELDHADDMSDGRLVTRCMLAAFSYYREKFEGLWFSGSKLEAILRKHRPSLEHFVQSDFVLLVQSMLFLLTGHTYNEIDTSVDACADLRLDLWAEKQCRFRTVVKCYLQRGPLQVSRVREVFGEIAAEVADGFVFSSAPLSVSARKFVALANRSPHANRLHIVEPSKIKRLLPFCESLLDVMTGESFEDPDSEEFILVEPGTEPQHVADLRTRGMTILKEGLEAGEQQKLF